MNYMDIQKNYHVEITAPEYHLKAFNSPEQFQRHVLRFNLKSYDAETAEQQAKNFCYKNRIQYITLIVRLV